MIRRSFLKLLLATPLAGLFKKKNPTFIEPDIPPTTGTSSDTRIWIFSKYSNPLPDSWEGYEEVSDGLWFSKSNYIKQGGIIT